VEVWTVKVGDKVYATESGRSLISDIVGESIPDDEVITGRLVTIENGWHVFQPDNCIYANPNYADGEWYLFEEDVAPIEEA
jgi:hypothetical protein